MRSGKERVSFAFLWWGVVHLSPCACPGTLLYHSPPHSLETGSLSDLGSWFFSWSGSQHSPVSAPYSTMFTDVHTPGFSLHAGDWNSGLHARASSLPHGASPQLRRVLSWGWMLVNQTQQSEDSGTKEIGVFLVWESISQWPECVGSISVYLSPASCLKARYSKQLGDFWGS